MRIDPMLIKKPRRALGLFAVDLQAGFTLIEMVVALVIVGILAAVVLPRWSGRAGFEERSFRDETAAALRFAQKSAIAARRVVCVTFAAGQISLQISNQTPEASADCSVSTPLMLATGASSVQGANFGNATYSSFPAGGVVFDAAGRNTGLAATISVNGLPDLPITVEAETGYVH